MKSRTFRLLCMLLCLTMLVQLLPASALAAEKTLTEKIPVVEEPVSVDMENTSLGKILCEDVTKRTEVSKEFVMEGGLRMAVAYGEPVHYEQNGAWEEIDNTLKAVGGTYTNTAGAWQVSFPQQLSKDNAVTITKDGYTLRFYMAGELHGTLETAAKSGTLRAEAADQTLQKPNVASASTKLLDSAQTRAQLEYPETMPEKLCSEVSYSGVYAGTDIVYDLKSNQVKESVVMNAYQKDLQGYRYTLNVGTLNPVLTDSGEIQLYDGAKQNVVMVMPAPL